MKNVAEVRKGAFVEQRQGFKLMLASNVNYFGTLIDSTLQPVFPMAINTHYEELKCVGYHPQQRQLEAVVYVYQPSGYGSDVCGPGTPEFVRFYLSYDGGATWQDQGMTSFQAFNIPEGTQGEKHLEYAVSLKVQPEANFCYKDPLIRVRAILSWNDPPLPNQPNWTPVWGNTLEQTILVEPWRLMPLGKLLEVAELKLPEHLEAVLDPDLPIKTKKKVLGPAELMVLYKRQEIPVHRFAFKELKALVSGQGTLSAQSFVSQFPGLKIDPDLIKLLFPTDGDTGYEELKCIGLDPNLRDTLVGVIQVKLPSGYSGNPCSDGSREYVTFWADANDDGTFEICLGTADVTVYDVANMPPEGVWYAVRLPVDLAEYRQPCEEGARLLRVRAILSWNVAAPCADPNHVPVWGNREETVIHITPVAGAPAGYIHTLGGIPVSMIDSTTGETLPAAKFAVNNLPPDPLARPCPFGGRVAVQGWPIPGFTYIVEVSNDEMLWAPVLTDLMVEDKFGGTATHKADPVTKRFAYLPGDQNVQGLLAEWDTAGDEKWYVRLTVYDAGGVQQPNPDIHVIQLDNTRPEASITMGPLTPPCGKFPVGTKLSGTFVARDQYFGGYALTVLPPINLLGTDIPDPSTGNVQTAPDPGDTWQLETDDMEACGYVLRLWAWDRAIVNSQANGHWKEASVGFCLEKK
jgi:hypothetical protein